MSVACDAVTKTVGSDMGPRSGKEEKGEFHDQIFDVSVCWNSYYDHIVNIYQTDGLMRRAGRTSHFELTVVCGGVVNTFVGHIVFIGHL